MARSRPDEPLWDDAPPAERLLWRWAVEQLPDDVLVLPSVAMTITKSGRPDEAEVDLVVVDPDGGVTVVEVKGGTIEFDADRSMWLRRTDHGGRKPIRNPVDQAKRARTHLRTALDKAAFRTGAIALRWAVGVPECHLDAPGGVVLDDDNLWDARCVDGLELAWRRTVGGLTTGEQPLGTNQATAIVSLLRGRSREGSASLRAAVDDTEASIRILTESHRNVVHRFAHNRFVLVRGTAGTGKTMLALEVAAMRAAAGRRVLLACWNIVLGDWLRTALQDRLAEMGSPVATAVTDDPTGQVVVGHLVGLARRAGRSGDGVVPPAPSTDTSREEQQHYYHEVMPELLAPDNCGGDFDVVVLDEAQDVTASWALAVRLLVGDGGTWLAFSDRQQDLFAARADLPDFLEVEHELDENFRNSAAIAEVASWFGEISTDCIAGEGPPVAFVACDQDDVADRAKAEARRLGRDDKVADEDLALLWLFTNPYRGQTDELADMAAADELIETNSASFKGMERPVVVVGLDMDPTRTDHHSVDVVRRAIYAAVTRARSHLTLVGDPDSATALGFTELARELRRTSGTDPR